MPITAPVVKIITRYTYLGQRCENIQYFEPVGAAFLTATMTGVLEAYWNDVKTAFRAIMTDFSGDATYDSILGEEIGGGNSYAEYAVPTLERAGTRSTAGLGDPVASFMAGGFRQTVGTRDTRPGQKRLPFLFEADTLRNALGGTYLTLLTAVAVKYCTTITLGAPVATGTLVPVITRQTGSPPVIVARQAVTGYIVNPNATSQNSRKLGRGS